ncbi:MAG TPA: D-alanine--D-alanine ligase family protein [Saprospiraceae bacterium]|nr:D-alanine--D-alanine ligase family protein [Saprospiraceae bacterium]HNG88964.1 D-alanine--D-alanine ligase family protein [Saprospiraceae bacterium]
MHRKNIAILTGGDSAERVISLKSGQVVRDHLPAERYRSFLIDIQKADWRDLDSGTQLDKNDFSLTLAGEKIHFDCAFAALHGSPLEDGRMQGYLDMLGIPYTCCDGYVSALTMNKHNTKAQLAPYGVPMSPAVLLRAGMPFEESDLLRLGLPLFVKPNDHGSSFGVTKVKTVAELAPAIEEAFRYSREVMVEAFMPGREFSNGVLRVNGEIVVLPITEIIPETEFFDFAAKYEGKSKEVTPAQLSPELTRQCQERSRLVYDALQCRGVVRVDYILVGETFHLLEPNTIPGISPASIVPQQAVSHGWGLGEFFSLLIEEAMR